MMTAYLNGVLINVIRVLALLLLLLTALTTPSSTTALRMQSSCEDPFENQEVRFPTSYWTETDFCKRSIEFSEIRSGGPAPDGIPPIDEPAFESVEAAQQWLAPQSPVIALEIDGDARAYPLAILIWHEIANDIVGDVPVAVTFCPLCNSSIVFDRRVENETLRFGVSGLLRNSDLVMWDDQTQSWWQQFTGQAIVGAYTGTELTVIPATVVGFDDFVSEYPDGQVLSRDTGFSRLYGSNPYIGYDTSTSPFLFEGEIDDRLPPMTHVLGAIVMNEAVAYPFETLSQVQVVNDEVGGLPVVAFWQDGVTSALDQGSIDDSRMIGTASLYSRTVEDEILNFEVDEDGIIRDVETGSAWNAFGRATAGELEGTQLFQEISGPYFWFAWAAFRPETLVFESVD
jgi:hypothetical protein